MESCNLIIKHRISCNCIEEIAKIWIQFIKIKVFTEPKLNEQGKKLCWFVLVSLPHIHSHRVILKKSSERDRGRAHHVSG